MPLNWEARPCFQGVSLFSHSEAFPLYSGIWNVEVGGDWERGCHVDQGLRYFDNLHIAQGRGSTLQRGRSRAGARGSAKQIDIEGTLQARPRAGGPTQSSGGWQNTLAFPEHAAYLGNQLQTCPLVECGPQWVLTLGTVYVLTLMCPLVISAPLSFPAVSSPTCELSPSTQFCADGSQKSIYNPHPSPKLQNLTSIYLRRPRRQPVLNMPALPSPPLATHLPRKPRVGATSIPPPN